jgi:hypothetical protein
VEVGPPTENGDDELPHGVRTRLAATHQALAFLLNTFSSNTYG